MRIDGEVKDLSARLEKQGADLDRDLKETSRDLSTRLEKLGSDLDQRITK